MKKKKQLSLLIINLFIVIAVVALAATAYLTFARAKVTLPETRESFTTNATVAIAATGGEETVLGDVITREYTRSTTVPVGSSVSQATKAGGTVTIINTTGRSQSLVATTRLLTPDNKLFRIQEFVSVPAGGRVSVFAEADATGDQFLIGPSRFTIPGLAASIQDEIYAESSVAMTYDRFASGTVTEAVVRETEKTLHTQILEAATNDLASAAPSGFMLHKNSIVVETVERTANPAVGASAQNVTVTVRAEVVALVINEAELRTAVEEQLKAELPSSQAFLEDVPESLVVTLNSIDPVNKTASVSVKQSAWVSEGALENTIDRRQLAGKNPTAAKEYLASQGFNNAEITLTPSWMPILPLLADHITLVSE